MREPAPRLAGDVEARDREPTGEVRKTLGRPHARELPPVLLFKRAPERVPHLRENGGIHFGFVVQKEPERGFLFRRRLGPARRRDADREPALREQRGVLLAPGRAALL